MRMFLFTLLILFFAESRLPAQNISYNHEFRVNTLTSGSQNRPKIIPLKNGNFVACWVTYIENKYSAYGQLFDSSATKIGSEFKLNSGHYLTGFELAVDALHDGGFIVFWRVDGIVGQIFNSDGTMRGLEFEVYGSFYGFNPATAVLRNDDFIVLWHKGELDGSDTGIFGQLYDSNGNRKGGNVQLNAYWDNGQAYPDIAARSDGGFVACWQSWGQDGSDYGIVAQLFNGEAEKIGDEFIVNTFTEHIQRYPSIISLENGGFAISWTTVSADGNNRNIQAQLFNEDGSRNNEEFQVNSYSRFYQHRSKMAGLPRVGFIICWISSSSTAWGDSQDGGGSGIYAQLFNHDGSKWGTEFRVNDYTLSTQFFPSVSHVADNRMVILWESYEQDGDKSGVFGKYYKTRLNHSLYPFSLLSPKTDFIFNSTSVTFSWNAAVHTRLNFPWDIIYTLYLDDAEDFSSPLIIANLTDTTYQAQNLTPGTTYFWKVLVKNIEDASLWSAETSAFFVSHNAVSLLQDSQEKPEVFRLHQNYPNPFNPSTTILFEVAHPENVLLKIFDVQGKEIAVLKDEYMQPGQYQVTFNAKDLPSAVYFCHIQTGTHSGTKKMVLIR